MLLNALIDYSDSYVAIYDKIVDNLRKEKFSL